jgi:hypothetical protein
MTDDAVTSDAPEPAPPTTAELYGLDADPDRGHRDVPLAVDLLAGHTVTVDDGTTRESAVVVVDPDLFARAAWMKREGERMVRLWRAGNLRLWSAPVLRGEPALVEITDDEGIARLEEIRYPVYTALAEAQRHEGG